MKSLIKILLIEDDEDDYFIIKEMLSRVSYFEHELVWITKTEELSTLNKQGIDICIADYFLGKTTAIDTLKFLEEKEFNIPTIVLTGMNSKEKDIEVMKAGATDYLSKEKINPEKLERAIRYAIQHYKVLNQFKIERNKFQKLFDLNTDLIIILDSNFKVIDLNNQVLQTLNLLKKEDVLKKKIDDLIITPNMFELLRDQKNIENKETELLFYNSTKIRSILSLTEIFDSNNLTECYQIIIKDVSEVAKAKMRLRNVEKINFSGKMAQTLAHEIRNPLTNISLSISFLKSVITGEDKYLDMVLKNSNKINEITTNFINNTKAVELKIEKTPLNKIIREAIDTCQDRVNLKNIVFNTSIAETQDIIVNADFEKLSIAIGNIILNATEAIENTSTPTIDVNSKIQGNKTILTISDNGKGISEEKLKTIFEPFATDKKSGIGVGLSSVYNIISMHNGDIEVKSNIGEGTTFYIKMESEQQ